MLAACHTYLYYVILLLEYVILILVVDSVIFLNMLSKVLIVVTTGKLESLTYSSPEKVAAFRKNMVVKLNTKVVF